MSTGPNDAFNDDFSGGTGAQTAQAPPPKSKKGCLIAVVVVFLLMFLVCCGGLLAMFYFGSGALGEAVIAEVGNDPAIVEHIGDVESCSLDLGETAKAAEAAEQAGDQTPLAFEIKGSKGEAVLLLMQDGRNQNEFSSGTLILPNGERIPLESLGQDADAVGIDLDIDVGDLIDDGEPGVDDADEASDATRADAAAADATAEQPAGSDTDDAKDESSE